MMIRTAVVGGVAAAMLASVAPTAQAQGLGSLGNIFNCSNAGSNQKPGALVGGVLGGLAGAGVAKNDVLGGLLGAAVGAAAGSWIGCRLGGTDQASLEQATMTALNEGRSTTWSNPQTGASARINVYPDTTTASGYGYNSTGYNNSGYGGASTSPVYGQALPYNSVRLATRVSNAGGFVTTAPRYTALNQTYIRTSPSTRAATNGMLSRGEQFEAIARVQGQPWVLVGRNGYGVGYVPESSVRAVSESVTTSPYASPVTPISNQDIRLNSGVSWASGYESAPSMFKANSNAYLRATPSTTARSIGQVYRGDEVEAIAKVQGQPWILVGRNGYGIGYVHESLLTAQPTGSDVAYGGSNNAYGAPTSGYQNASSSCRIVEQVITTRDYASQTQRYRACRDTSGRWQMTAA